MTMRTRIKVCGITRVADGVAAARAGADAIGVVFWRDTPRCVDLARARDIAIALPPFVSVGDRLRISTETGEYLKKV